VYLYALFVLLSRAKEDGHLGFLLGGRVSEAGTFKPRLHVYPGLGIPAIGAHEV